MQKCSQLVLFLLIALTVSSQQSYKVSYQQLKEFEGVYTYVNNTTLKIAASPKDTLLYAVIGESKYPLKPAAQDLFLNTSKNKVQFYRDSSHGVAGYITDRDTFRLLSKDVFFPTALWYPRTPEASVYHYQQPADLKDGLKTGDVAQSGLDTALLGVMMRKIIDGTYPNVHSVLIIKDDKLVFEEYFYQYTKDSLHELRSATKSFISALTGIAIEKGFIKDKNEKVVSFFPEYTLDNNSDAKKKITVENLLSNQSGLDCDISNAQSVGNETTMDYSADWVKFTLDLPMIDTPGGKGMYCSGNPVTLGRIIEKATRQTLPQFARQTLFGSLGIDHFKWDFKPDQSSAETFCQLYMRPRDMAKFGQLYLDRGVWKGRQVVAADWVDQSFSNHAVVQGNGYGYLWWLKYLNAGGKKYYSKAAQGNGGQRINVWPEQHMVTIITGGNYNTQSPADELIAKYVLPAFSKQP